MSFEDFRIEDSVRNKSVTQGVRNMPVKLTLGILSDSKSWAAPAIVAVK
jgi:hypothetical protein